MLKCPVKAGDDEKESSCTSPSFVEERQAEQGTVRCLTLAEALFSQHWLTKAFVQFVFWTQQKPEWEGGSAARLNRRWGGGEGGAEWEGISGV